MLAAAADRVLRRVDYRDTLTPPVACSPGHARSGSCRSLRCPRHTVTDRVQPQASAWLEALARSFDTSILKPMERVRHGRSAKARASDGGVAFGEGVEAVEGGAALDDTAHPPAATASRHASRSRSRGRRATIFDVARTAGVSYSTVSRVVNDYAHVNEATRERVRAAMREHGYVAHVTARALASGRTQAIGLLAQEIDNPFFSVVIKGVDQAVSVADYDLLLCTTHSRREKEAEYVARLSWAWSTACSIVVPHGLPDYVAQLRAAALPVRAHRPRQRSAWLHHGERRQSPGTREGIGLSHRRWAHRRDRVHHRPARRGRDASSASPGYREALSGGRAAGRSSRLVVVGDFLEARGYEAARELLSLPQPPTAIFASSDAAAFGVLGAARDTGSAVPGDLSVLGFDDIVEASHMGAALSTVRQPLREMGHVAVQRLLSLLADPTQPPARLVMETELVIRETTAAPRSSRAV